MPAALFAGAPRFAGDGIIGTDEVSAILHRDEGVFTPEQMRAFCGAGLAPTLELQYGLSRTT